MVQDAGRPRPSPPENQLPHFVASVADEKLCMRLYPCPLKIISTLNNRLQ